MKKIFNIILGIFRGFILNPFWKSVPVIITIVLSLAINGFLWYMYLNRIKVNPVPFFFASAVIVLNLILGNFLYPREKLVSFLFVYTLFFVQVLTLIYLKYLLMVY